MLKGRHRNVPRCSGYRSRGVMKTGSYLSWENEGKYLDDVLRVTGRFLMQKEHHDGVSGNVLIFL